MRKLLSLTLALMICAGVFLFPLTAYAAAEIPAPATETDLETADDETAGDLDTDPDVDADPEEETESAVPPYDGTGNITPDGAGTVIDNVFIEGNGLEFFTFTTEAGNVFYLVVDRLRTMDNVYFLNAVTEQDLIALAEKDGVELTGTSGIPSAPGETTPADPTGEPEPPEEPTANKGGVSGGTLIFILIGAAAVGIAGYYFKIMRPKQQRAADDDSSDYGDGDDYDDYGEPEDDYGTGDEDTADRDGE